MTVAKEKQNLENVNNARGKEINQQVINELERYRSDGLYTMSMPDLYDTPFPPRISIVDGLLYTGAYLFVGAPKIGKSFFVAQLAYHVAMGIPLWDHSVRRGTVLYLALEDDYSRLQQRLSNMFGLDCADNLHFAVRAKTLSEGLEKQLTEFVKDHRDTRLIIVDTLQKVRDVGGDKYSYDRDYKIASSLKEFSDRNNLCLMVVHHTRKMEASDSFEMISGTNGLLGAVDGAIILCKKKRIANEAIMDIVGRDQPDQELILEFDRKRCSWNLKKKETEPWKLPPDPVLDAIARVVSVENQRWEGTATELLNLLPEVEMQPNSLSRKLNVSSERLYNEYQIRHEMKRNHQGRYLILELMMDEV